MGVSHADIETLNRSIEGVGQSFVERRREQELLKQQGIQNDLRDRALKAQMEHYETMGKAANATATARTNAATATATARSDAAALKAKDVARITWKGTVDTMNNLLKAGHLKPEQLPQVFQQAADKLPPAMVDQLRDDPLFLTTTDPNFTVSPKEPPVLTPAGAIPPEGALTPGGHYVPPRRPAGSRTTVTKPGLPGQPPEKTVTDRVPIDSSAVAPMAPTMGTNATIRLVRDPKTGLLVPAK